MADIFISYSKQDKALAEQLAGLLQEIGFSVWWDADLVPAEDQTADRSRPRRYCHMVAQLGQIIVRNR